MIKRIYLNDKQEPANIIYPITDEKSVRDSNNVTLESKLADLNTIREGAALGATAYQKPQTGIPASDIANGVIPDVSSFITKSVSDLVYYYTKSETYTKEEVAALIGAIQQFHYEIATSTADVSSPANNVLYLIGPTGSGADKYEEYVYDSTKDNPWIKIGDTSIDLSNYVTISALNTALANYTTTADLTTLLSGKQDTLVSGTNIKTVNGESLLGSGNITAGDPNAVKYTEQTLTSAQQEQARTNIGAGTYSKPSGGIPATDLASGVIPDVSGKEDLSNKVSAISGNESSTTKYTSVKSVWDEIKDTPLIDDQQTSPLSPLNLETTGNKKSTLTGNETSEQYYPNMKALADAIGKWGVVSQTQTWTGSDDTGYDYTMSDLVWGIIPNADIEKYKNLGSLFGPVFNETTGYFELNGISDISYKEMVEIYKYSVLLNLFCWSGGYMFRNNKTLRTIPYISNGSAVNFQYSLSGTEKLEVINGGFYASSYVSTFQNCYHLREITGMSVLYVTGASTSAFQNCYCLEKVQLRGLKVNLSLNNSPRVSLGSVVFIVGNAANTTAITITLHATAYARMQADTTEYTYNSQTYTGILAYASAKNITIASA